MRPSLRVAAALGLAACVAIFVVVPARGQYAAAASGCKSVTTFTSSAVPAMRKDGCLGCHAGTSPEATGVFNLTSVGKDDTAACAQALNKVNLLDKPQSAIIQAAAGTQTHVGGKVADTQTFTTALLAWINNE